MRTIKSIQANTFQDYRVWIIDQSEDAATATAVQRLAAADTRITYIHSQTKGVNISRNIGIAAGQAPIVALTADDCTVAEIWLAALAAEYETYPECCSLAAITKYVRGGDRASLHLLGSWLWHLGIRQILSGLLKYRSWHKMYAGALQLIYPWVGAWQSRHYVIDPYYRVYTGKKGQVQKLPVINPPL